MPAWSRTVKPVISTIDPDDIYGVDKTEQGITAGVAAPGWVRRRVVGTRVIHEVLVAMKNPPTEDNDDDTEFPEMTITFTTQPSAASLVAGTADADLFGTVEAEASDEEYAGTITYSWEMSDDDGETWVAVEAADFETEATATLGSNSNTDSGYDGYLFRAKAIDSDGDTGAVAYSDEVELTVTIPVLAITDQPDNHSAATGQAASFTIVTSIAPAGLYTKTYQWEISTDDGETWGNVSNGGVYSGATLATLSISDNTGLDGNQYRCIADATGPESIAAVTSSAATLTETV
jgi:hypothetical protein